MVANNVGPRAEEPCAGLRAGAGGQPNLRRRAGLVFPREEPHRPDPQAGGFVGGAQPRAGGMLAPGTGKSLNFWMLLRPRRQKLFAALPP